MTITLRPNMKFHRHTMKRRRSPEELISEPWKCFSPKTSGCKVNKVRSQQRSKAPSSSSSAMKHSLPTKVRSEMEQTKSGVARSALPLTAPNNPAEIWQRVTEYKQNHSISHTSPPPIFQSQPEHNYFLPFPSTTYKLFPDPSQSRPA